ncbi:MAG: 2-C-methyl-D-erythritol 4-phosphate cytidylyltransferase [Candidatus Brocadiia bacterium]
MSQNPYQCADECPFAVVVPAAGVGVRMGNRKKPYLHIGGRPILHHTLERLLGTPGCEQAVVVLHRDEHDGGAVEDELRRLFGPTQTVCGGDSRQASVLAGLQAVRPELELVLVHDAVRPLVRTEVVRRVAHSSAEHGAAIAAVRAEETVKEVNGRGTIVGTPPRRRLWYARTPQGFRRELLLRAHAHARRSERTGTDDAELVEKLGHEVHLVEDCYDNIKITTEEDLVVAEAILRWQQEHLPQLA